jgi:hypothetical protein
MNKSYFEKFKGQHIPILDWRFFENEAEAADYHNSYEIGKKYTLIGNTIVGDLLALKKGTLLLIDHEEPIPKNDFKLSKKLKVVVEVIEKTLAIPDFEDCEDIKKLKSIKKLIKQCKKIAPGNLKDYFESAMDDTDEEIYFLKD